MLMFNEISWLSPLTDAWRTRVAQGRVPHAVLFDGKSGVGKRAFAAWLVRQHLGIETTGPGPAYPLAWPEHADMHLLTTPEDKHSIGVDAVRALIDALSLTSYEGGGKAAVIEPANAMTDNAANSLLKTLEEPAGNSLIVLVADRAGRLPATIFSRCQRIPVARPDRDEALAWLQAIDASVDWPAALVLSGGAPLEAIRLADRVEEATAMAGAFSRLAAGQASALELAAQWAKLDSAFVLQLIAGQVEACIRRVMLGSSRAPDDNFPESVIRHIDRRNLFCYLDIINRLKAQAPGSFNVALTLESLLIEWSNGLNTCRDRFGPGELLPGTVTG